MNRGLARGLGLAPFIPDVINTSAGGSPTTDGFVPQMDSTQQGALGLGTRAYNFNNQTIGNISQVYVGEVTPSAGSPGISPTVPGIEVLQTGTYSPAGSGSVYGLRVGGTATFSGAPTATSALIRADATWVFNAVSAKTQYSGMYFGPTFSGNTAPQSMTAFACVPVYGQTAGTLGTFYGQYLFPTINGSGGTITTATMLAIGDTYTAGTVGTLVALDIGNQLAFSATGATVWAVRVGNYNSFWAGKTAFNGSATPTWGIHLQGSASATNAIGFDSSTTEPSVPASNGMAFSNYAGSGGTNKYIMFKVNDGGTTRYITANFHAASGTVTWTAATTVPT